MSEQLTPNEQTCKATVGLSIPIYDTTPQSDSKYPTH